MSASTGIVCATVVAMGMIALPAMLRAGYDPRKTSGIVCTAGTLGQIIPPSNRVIIPRQMSCPTLINMQQYEQGKFTVERVVGWAIFCGCNGARCITRCIVTVVHLVSWRCQTERHCHLHHLNQLNHRVKKFCQPSNNTVLLIR